MEFQAQQHRVDFDKVLDRIGHFGCYQRIAVFVLALACLPAGLHAVASVFEAAVPEFSCQSQYAANDAEVVSNTSGGGSDHDNACKTYRVDDGGTNKTVAMKNATLLPCEDFDYDTSVFKSTIVTEWDLVCDRAWLRAVSTSFFMLGNLLGAIVAGHVADRFGRKSVFFVNLLLIVCGCAAAFAPNYWTYVSFRTATGAACTGIVAITFILGAEIVGLAHRRLSATVMACLFSCGVFSLAGLAFLLREYFWLQLVISLSSLPLIPMLYWVGESPRWLLRQAKWQEAEREIQRMAKINGSDAPADLLNTTEVLCDALENKKVILEETSHESGQHVLALVRRPNMRCLTLNIWYTWIVVAMVYYGLSLSSSVLVGSPFLNLFLMGLAELLGLALHYLPVERLGRKPVLSASMLMCGTACTLIPAVPEGLRWIVTAMAVTGKVFISAAFSVIYIYTAEIYPTRIRTIGLSTGSMVARIGSVLAPFVVELGILVWTPLPQIVFGVLSLISGFLCLLLPETLGQKLPDTEQDAENFARRRFRCLFFMKNKRKVPGKQGDFSEAS